MSFMRVSAVKIAIIGGTAALLFPLASIDSISSMSSAYASTASDLNHDKDSSDFLAFRPNPVSRSKLDYAIWNEALAKVVLDFGPSTRLRAKKPSAGVGTRFVRGHKSAYRLEGTRFTFEFITDDYRQGLTDYRLSLQELATSFDITRLARNEQLAFWINFHNVALLEKIAENYPIKRPSRIRLKVNGKRYKIDEAPFIEIKGKNISLKDIRENTVYRFWDDSNVIYGFFRGEIGGPSLQSYAYTGDSVTAQLNQNAEDFVNSLRGFNLGASTKYVSRIYQEAAPFFFKDWENDLQSHLLLHANEAVYEEVKQPFPYEVDSCDEVIADLSAGYRLGSSGAPTNNTGLSFETRRLLNEVRKKKDYLRRRNLIQTRGGYVIIEDLVPEEDKASNEPQN